MSMPKLITTLAMLMVLAACGTAADPAPASSLPAPTSTTTTSPTTTTTPPASTTTTTTPPPTTATTTPPDPAGPPEFDTWVAVLASLPTGDYDRAGAEAVAAGFGLARIEVLRSDDYPSLNPGYWVVYAGPAEHSHDAAWRCDQYRERAPDCYPRYLGVDPTQALGRQHGLALAYTDDGRLVALSTETGAVVRTISHSFGGDGMYPGSPELSADGRAAYYSVGFEDSWYSCESSVGDIRRMDLATGRAANIAAGFSPRLSPTGDRLLYLAASECFPDPENELWVRAPIDTVVVRDLVNGEEIRHRLPRPAGAEPDYELRSAVWNAADGRTAYVLDTAGTVWLDRGPGSDPLAVATLDAGQRYWYLAGADGADGVGLLAVSETWVDDAVRTELHLVYVATGAVEMVKAYEGRTGFGLDPAGVVTTAGETLASFDGDIVDLEIGILAIDW